MKNKFLFSIIMLAIVSATISPACAFISGKGGDFIEICSGLQTVKIKINGTSTPPDMTDNQCPFCFQFFQGGGLENTALTLTNKPTDFYRGFYTESALSQHLKSTGNRDPPILIS